MSDSKRKAWAVASAAQRRIDLGSLPGGDGEPLTSSESLESLESVAAGAGDAPAYDSSLGIRALVAAGAGAETGTTGAAPATTPATPSTNGSSTDAPGTDDPALRTLPVIDTNTIQGPSGGLAMTLALLDAANPGDLTGGRVVAATGTINPDGTVGAIGGAPFKLRAVVRDGARVFFVPRGNLNELREIPWNVTVVPVEHWTDALRWLCAHGATDASCSNL